MICSKFVFSLQDFIVYTSVRDQLYAPTKNNSFNRDDTVAVWVKSGKIEVRFEIFSYFHSPI